MPAAARPHPFCKAIQLFPWGILPWAWRMRCAPFSSWPGVYQAFLSDGLRQASEVTFACGSEQHRPADDRFVCACDLDIWRYGHVDGTGAYRFHHRDGSSYLWAVPGRNMAGLISGLMRKPGGALCRCGIPWTKSCSWACWRTGADASSIPVAGTARAMPLSFPGCPEPARAR